MYKQIRSVQGKHVPVCLGLVDLVLPYYYDGGKFMQFLFFSWAGRSMSGCIDKIDRKLAIQAEADAFAELHNLRVHGDAEPRNILYDVVNRSFMVTVLERSEFRERRPLGAISLNGCGRKRKRKGRKKQGGDLFTKELRCVLASASRCLDTMQSIKGSGNEARVWHARGLDRRGERPVNQG
ncbi:hypothetical protein F5883DRAFT_252608 [Diaporthe sp. PMI_573]|nr:hypothetical protein F5883DRAFT_252608 [Diaporthaceae sp. PMI_573]